MRASSCRASCAGHSCTTSTSVTLFHDRVYTCGARGVLGGPCGVEGRVMFKTKPFHPAETSGRSRGRAWRRCNRPDWCATACLLHGETKMATRPCFTLDDQTNLLDVLRLPGCVPPLYSTGEMSVAATVALCLMRHVRGEAEPRALTTSSLGTWTFATRLRRPLHCLHGVWYNKCEESPSMPFTSGATTPPRHCPRQTAHLHHWSSGDSANCPHGEIYKHA